MPEHREIPLADRHALVQDLIAAGIAVGARVTDRLAAAHDASHYLLEPGAVVRPTDVDQLARTLAIARHHGVAATFRSGGTSLSGQASTSGLLIDTRRGFTEIEVLDDGLRVRCAPGATLRSVNARLARYGRKLGPDPASEIACTVGGVVANNSSGMACGVELNTYRTLDSLVVVLADGTLVDTAQGDADEAFRASHPGLSEGLDRLRDRVRTDEAGVATLRRLHSIKNTMGYGLNSLLDYDRPIDILEHLIVGSEGTLAFIAEATFRTVPLHPEVATGLLVFPTLAEATAALPPLVDCGFATIELMDAMSLRVAQLDLEAPAQLRELRVIDHAALLVEFQEPDDEMLAARIRQAAELFLTLGLAEAVLSSNAIARAQLWHIRKGLYATVAGSRPPGTTALLEDIAVPVANLNATCTQLTVLFERHGYVGSVIFGHAKDGNIHFMINERFDDATSLQRYERFTEDMVELVLAMGGTLKAEHGTGRVMAPFVERQYGPELFAIMHEVKALFDPEGLLNPGVVLSDDPRAHLRDLKVNPTVEQEVDRCVECGYCEPVCPSRDLTLTPRERIVLRREMTRAEERGDTGLLATLTEEYDYDGVQTCAVDGMCQTACPVLINTGDLVRRLRTENQSRVTEAGWATAAKHWDVGTRAGGTALTIAKAVPSALPALATTAARRILGRDDVPLYSADLPKGGERRAVLEASDADLVFFSSCTTTMFAPVGSPGVAESFVALCRRAGLRVATPPEIPSLCCGTPWKSKGLADGYAFMKDKVARSLRAATDGGRLPVVCDASSCTEGLEVLVAAAGELGIRVVDAVAYVDASVLPRLPELRRLDSVTVHPTCSSTRLGINGSLLNVAAAVADTVFVPDDWGCCAFAGDRGMLHPELTASATAAESRSVAAAASSAHASLNRTCELGMTRATGTEYQHVLQLLARAAAG